AQNAKAPPNRTGVSVVAVSGRGAQERYGPAADKIAGERQAFGRDGQRRRKGESVLREVQAEERFDEELTVVEREVRAEPAPHIVDEAEGCGSVFATLLRGAADR